MEERTGYGGGYKERENVEYKDRKESDDEFDEFGRRKKKYRKNVEVSQHFFISFFLFFKFYSYVYLNFEK